MPVLPFAALLALVASCGPSPREAGRLVLTLQPAAFALGLLLSWFFLWISQARVSALAPVTRHWRVLAGLGVLLVVLAMPWRGVPEWRSWTAFALYCSSYATVLLLAARIALSVAPERAWLVTNAAPVLVFGVPALMFALTDLSSDNWFGAHAIEYFVLPGTRGFPPAALGVLLFAESVWRGARRRARSSRDDVSRPGSLVSAPAAAPARGLSLVALIAMLGLLALLLRNTYDDAHPTHTRYLALGAHARLREQGCVLDPGLGGTVTLSTLERWPDDPDRATIIDAQAEGHATVRCGDTTYKVAVEPAVRLRLQIPSGLRRLDDFHVSALGMSETGDKLELGSKVAWHFSGVLEAANSPACEFPPWCRIPEPGTTWVRGAHAGSGEIEATFAGLSERVTVEVSERTAEGTPFTPTGSPE